MNIFLNSATLLHQHPHTRARVMKITTPHGTVITPAFMPVGTRAFVNLMTPQDLHDTQSQIILGGNTYHMLCSPGMETIQAIGGMHRMMGWEKPMLTDSGGFQVFSLSNASDLCKIDENGARFKHPISGKLIHLNAVTSIEAQKIMGADIIMAFDQCTPDDVSEEEAEKIMERTHRWLFTSIETHQKNTDSVYGLKQALFGIIQGGTYQKLREKSAEFIVNANVDGIAIGGESVGFNMPKTMDILNWIHPFLPDHKIRYSMGVGLHPRDLIDVVAQGVDIFDCVAPTRNARHGSLYHGFAVPKNNWVEFDDCGEEKGQILIKKAKYATDQNPILVNCQCHTCQHHSRAYLHYLLKQASPLFNQLASIHNVQVMQKTCEVMRETIYNGDGNENIAAN
ncbi:MAG: tRNA-guanine(34) transglycosylase [Gammaproteobacteria bacterium RIFCSPLOWO2_02_FULL_42_14]|nr:MAG: tRNA-guanine(34) transglycosylase [Gammaproteobacteria bacterium RIFCSPHIGHO2_02_FULL_42_43]OGT52377.1 MAG: tRNA-guanine(34) transglycosylase [Gammaproteobacteria bacterium RIFCSPHIGHO2_12_FULL_41_25]OGT63332.1 MAG: tRNA-guanine(34) transglycosylase [Gammaproteobacteria bacterium RIFCSPLOWO2_02_FULL_42_14]OGT86300.1 MAG: tRNA-guanine(34) transglycosylase [Gammaproteobacteria bacterium RIFCSPLOWO2_12_FULL_42_18]